MSRCRSCGADIRWAQHEGSGNWMPLEEAPPEATRGLYRIDERSPGGSYAVAVRERLGLALGEGLSREGEYHRRIDAGLGVGSNAGSYMYPLRRLGRRRAIRRQWRYSTWAEAEAGHRAAVELARRASAPFWRRWWAHRPW